MISENVKCIENEDSDYSINLNYYTKLLNRISQLEKNVIIPASLIQMIIDSIPLSIIIISERRIKYINENALFLLDYKSKKKLINSSYLILIKNNNYELLQNNNEKKFIIQSRNGSPVHIIQENVKITINNQKCKMMFFHEDLKKNKEKCIQRAFINYNVYYKHIFDDISTGILFYHNKFKCFLTANKQLCRMLGYKANEFKMLQISSLIKKDNISEIREKLSSSSGEKAAIKNIQVIRKDGSILKTHVLISCINILKDPYKKITFSNISNKSIINTFNYQEEDLRDENSNLRNEIAKLKASTSKFIQTEKLLAMGEVTRGIAHELSQPLNVMKIIIQSTLRDINKNRYDIDQITYDFPDILNQMDKMAEIIDLMRIFSKSSTRDYIERVNVNIIIKDVIRFVEQQMIENRINITCSLQTDLPHCHGHYFQILQVIMNLILNARNAMIKIKKKLKKISIKTYSDQKSNMIVIEIADNGSGISKNIRDKIFDPFFTTEEPGNGIGLGLAVAGVIVANHKGRIEFDTSLGRGTNFKVYLPLT